MAALLAGDANPLHRNAWLEVDLYTFLGLRASGGGVVLRSSHGARVAVNLFFVYARPPCVCFDGSHFEHTCEFSAKRLKDLCRPLSIF
jgi:hypothetical protein